MGVTVSTAKLAAAYQANNGQTVYVLFEQTFDKNDYGVPTTPLSFKSSAIPIQSRLMLHIAVLRLVTDSPFCHWQKRRQCA